MAKFFWQRVDIADEAMWVFKDAPQTHLSLSRELQGRSPSSITGIMRIFLEDGLIEPAGKVATEVGEMTEYRWVGRKQNPGP